MKIHSSFCFEKGEQNMGFIKNRNGSIISEVFKIIKAFDEFYTDELCDVALYDSFLSFKTIFSKKEVLLQYDRINKIEYKNKTICTTKNKSVIARAFAAGTIFGCAGAFVGAISGIGKKHQKNNHCYFNIYYTASDGEQKVLYFEDTRNYKGKKLYKMLCCLCGFEKSDID